MIAERQMQSVKSLEAHGFKREEGLDSEGKRMVVWRRSEKRYLGFGYYPESGDTLPYLIDLKEAGYLRSPER